MPGVGLFCGAGALAGFFEWSRYAFEAEGGRSALLLACTAMGLTAGVGAVLGLAFVAAGWATRLVGSPKALALCFVVFMLGASPLPPPVIAMAPVAFVCAAWLARKAEMPCFLLIAFVWLGAEWTLVPLFAGQSLDLAFTGPHLSLTRIVQAPLLFLVLTAILVPLIRAPRVPRARALALVGGAATFAFLSFASSVFLVRVWEFHALQYLQIVVIALQILTLAVACRAAAWKTGSPLTGRIVAHRSAMALSLSLAASTVLAASFPDDAAARRILARGLPNTSFFIDHLRAAVDRDGDGFSALFGGSDCDDSRRNIAPDVLDFPGNGRDENCFGGDLRSIRHPYFGVVPEVTAPPRPSAGSAPSGEENPRRSARRIAVLLVIDTLRADAIGGRMPDGPPTPVLDEIAARSLDHRQARSPSNNTLESIPFLLQFGFRNLKMLIRDWTLGHYLQQARIPSAAVFQDDTPHWWSPRRDAILFGFDVREKPPSSVGLAPLPALMERAVHHLGRHREGDFFLLVHVNSLHDSFIKLLQGRRLAFSGANLSELLLLGNRTRLEKLMIGEYREVLREVDASVESLWRALLREEQEGAEVLLVVTSDHGEEFGEHGGFFHMGTLYEEVLRVPLLVYRTGIAPKRVSKAVGTHQVPSTILDFFGFRGAVVESFSLLGDSDLDTPIFATYSSFVNRQKRTLAIIDRDLKLIFDRGKNTIELYDLRADPGERHNLYEQVALSSQRERLEKSLDTLMFFMDFGDYLLARRLFHADQLFLEDNSLRPLP